ncbi:kinase-like protein [Trametes cingulata]|nr:kinase-like protein [Trametes cingulata]
MGRTLLRTLRPFSHTSSSRGAAAAAQPAPAPASPGQSQSAPASSTPAPARHWKDSEEPADEFTVSVKVYCPVVPGDILGPPERRRYAVLRKLGWGVYSTVWLVRDLEAEPGSREAYAAAKVMTRSGTKAHEEGLVHELAFLERIRTDSDSAHPGRAHVVHLRDHFYHCGHLCAILEPMSQNLHSFHSGWRRRLGPPALLRVVARQIVLGLQYLHDVCDIVHTDIKPANILLAPPEDCTSFFDDALRDYTPETAVVEGPDGARVTRVRTDPLEYPIPEFGQDLADVTPWRDVRVKIGDLGVACAADKVSEHFTDMIQSPNLRAPEVAIGAGWGKPADIWSLGSTLYELHMGQPLLAPRIHDTSVPTLQTMVIGDYPPELVRRGKYSAIFFEEDGTLKYPPPARRSIYELIPRRKAPDAALFADFLRLTFEFDPDRRATCAELLAHPWLNP